MQLAHDEAAEKSVLGAVLLDNDTFFRVGLEPADFHDPRHRELWAAMQRLAAAKKPIDVTTLVHELRHIKASFEESIRECTSVVPTADNVEFYAEIVRAEALTRRIRIACSELAASPLEGEELLQRLVAESARLSAGRTEGAVPMSQLAARAYTEIVEQRALRAQGATAGVGLMTGLHVLDDLLGGIQRGVITILGGRPSMGKSSLARTIAHNVNAQGIGVHVFSLEDRGSNYSRRGLADVGRVDLHRINTLNLDETDMRGLELAAAQLASCRGWLVDDSARLSAAQIAMRVRRHLPENGTQLVIVDYVQIMREPGTRRDDARMQVKLAVEDLHELARRENVAVLLLSQLSRALENRDDKRPTLADLREAGDLEQIADAVLFCYRDEMYNPGTSDRGIAEVLVRKNKHGRSPADARLAWDAPTATYRNLGHDSEDSLYAIDDDSAWSDVR